MANQGWGTRQLQSNTQAYRKQLHFMVKNKYYEKTRGRLYYAKKIMSL